VAARGLIIAAAIAIVTTDVSRGALRRTLFI